MLKQLLEERIMTLHSVNNPFQQHVYKLQNCVEVLGIEAKFMRIDNRKSITGYIADKTIFFKSLSFGQAIVTLFDGVETASVKVFVHPSGEIVAEVRPCLTKIEVIPVHYRPILEGMAIAVDLKGALKRYLIAQQMMDSEDSVVEVHYQSMHPNVLRDSYAGNFVLGYHIDGREMTSVEEYALANRTAILKFSQIVIQRQAVRTVIPFDRFIAFSIENIVVKPYEKMSYSLN
ncbi:hypothetical protein [Lysinibacillus piscis]|uniref:Uncharacterized protein n=1 Tax=Lysinibacillus piscis TaxID=2518931 RepID=A0ABQ5NQD0_9BACI|nr:hypothetical protein [Lysinibacillus sp. KH24]GLC90523.1 hypothetical protein LYSBPC_36500 [Lysinibacillus sp. KH24]